MEVIIILFVLVIIGYIITIHNKIIAYHNKCQRAWADVITQELQKIRSFPILEKLVEEHKIHEREVLTSITELRTALSNISANTQPDLDALQRVSQSSLTLKDSLKVVVENYPELKSSELYRQYMTEISELEGDISASLRIFNRNVDIFNTQIEI